MDSNSANKQRAFQYGGASSIVDPMSSFAEVAYGIVHRAKAKGLSIVGLLKANANSAKFHNKHCCQQITASSRKKYPGYDSAGIQRR